MFIVPVLFFFSFFFFHMHAASVKLGLACKSVYEMMVFEFQAEARLAVCRTQTVVKQVSRAALVCWSNSNNLCTIRLLKWRYNLLNHSFIYW